MSTALNGRHRTRFCEQPAENTLLTSEPRWMSGSGRSMSGSGLSIRCPSVSKRRAIPYSLARLTSPGTAPRPHCTSPSPRSPSPTYHGTCLATLFPRPLARRSISRARQRNLSFRLDLSCPLRRRCSRRYTAACNPPDLQQSRVLEEEGDEGLSKQCVWCHRQRISTRARFVRSPSHLQPLLPR